MVFFIKKTFRNFEITFFFFYKRLNFRLCQTKSPTVFFTTFQSYIFLLLNTICSVENCYKVCCKFEQILENNVVISIYKRFKFKFMIIFVKNFNNDNNLLRIFSNQYDFKLNNVGKSLNNYGLKKKKK